MTLKEILEMIRLERERLVAANTFGHYPDHTQAITNWRLNRVN